MFDESAIVWPSGEQVTVGSIRANADAAQRVCDAAWEGDGSLRTPDWVVQELAAVSYHASRMVVVIARAEELKRRAATVLERARARARWENSGMPDKRLAAHVVMVTVEEKEAYDDAVVAFEYARRIGNLLKDYTGRVQSIGKQVELVYRDAGRGQ